MGHSNVVGLLLAAGADVNHTTRRGNTALVRAAAHDQLDVAKLLLSAGADASIRNVYGYSAPLLAASKGHQELVALFID